jgi:predicted nucleic acid-binding protein
VANRDSLVLDACVLLNLLATGVIHEILTLAASRVLVCDLVRDESFYLKSDDGSDEQVLIDLQPHFDQGTIHPCLLENDLENQNFVDLAAQLDDGEAMSIAIALSRNIFLATDDKKARRIFQENTTNINTLLSTSDLVREWAEANELLVLEVKAILIRIETIARYFPPNSDRNYAWWNDVMTS